MDADVVLNNRLFHIIRDGDIVQAIKDIIADPIQDTDDVANYILDHRDVDSAEGEHLEFIGELLGVKRPKAQELPENIFTLRRIGEVSDPDKGFEDDSDPTVTTGGYMTTLSGVESVTDPGADMPDADYRFLIKQKGTSYRQAMTDLNLYNYLIAFGARCTIDGSTSMTVIIDPFNSYDMDNWEKNYAVTRGFKPAGVAISFRDMVRHEGSI
ncbi:MAG: DUF2612 domain-containing protein [Chloroflexi bacterium]|nr:DUF2612 domain-containing protein [Chloroflexota bacterium]